MADMDKDLKTLLTEARRDVSAPQALLGRVLADAHDHQPVRRAPRRAQIVALLGGWRGMAGLAAASAAGVWLGFAPPALLPDPVALVLDAQEEFAVLGGDELALLLAEEG